MGVQLETIPNEMEPTVELAGFFAAHAIWCVSDGGPLVPILGIQQQDQEPKLQRLVDNDLQQAVVVGQERLTVNPDGASRAVLIYDVYMTLQMGRTDTLLIDLMEYAEKPLSARMAIPYRSTESPDGFAIYSTMFLASNGAQLSCPRPLAEAFFRGVGSHAEGPRLWDQYHHLHPRG
jgi:hypothetical protein